MRKEVKARKPAKPVQPKADLNERSISYAEKRIDDLRKQLTRGVISQDEFFASLDTMLASTRKLQPEAATLIQMKANAALDEGRIIEQRGAAAGMVRALRDQKKADKVRVTAPDKETRMAKGFAAAAENVARPIRLQTAKTTFGGEVSAADFPAVKIALEQAASARTPSHFRMAESAAKSAASDGLASQRKRTGLGRSAIGAGVLALLGKAIFGSGEGKKAPIDPQIQMALMQQMQNSGPQEGGVNTSRTLMDAGRLMTLLKGLQGMASMSGPTPTTGLV